MIVQPINVMDLIPADLHSYILEYMKKHTYTKARDIAWQLFKDNGFSNGGRHHRREIIALIYKIIRIITKLLDEGVIERYNNNVYKIKGEEKAPCLDHIEGKIKRSDPNEEPLAKKIEPLNSIEDNGSDPTKELLGLGPLEP